MQLLAVVCVVGAYAVNVGEYLYSPKAKFKVTGTNLVTNGDFNVGDGYEGWTSEVGGPVSGETWGIENAAGPNGENAIVSRVATADEGTQLLRVWQLSPGTYTISYWIKGASAGNTSVIYSNSSGTVAYTDKNNFITFFKSPDGTNVMQIIDDQSSMAVAIAQNQASTIHAFSTEWQQMVETITMTDAAPYLVFNAKTMAEGISFTGFEIHNAMQVFDTRILERSKEYLEKLVAEEGLPNEKELLQDALEPVLAMLADPAQAEDIEAMTPLVENVDYQVGLFLDANAGDTQSGDWKSHAYSNWNSINNATVVGNWKTLGDRWGFSPNDESLERPAGDGYVLTAGIQTSYNHANKGVMVERTDLKPGKYFFKIEAQAVAASNMASPYGSDNTRPVVGPSLWIGTDTLTYENEALNDDYWKVFYRIADVKEGDTVRAGFMFPTYDDGMGGRYSLRNPEFRMIGKSNTELTWEFAAANAIAQQTELKARLDNYMNDVAAQNWGKDSLQIAINNAQAVYDNSLTMLKGDASYENKLSVVTTEGSSNVPVTEDGAATLTSLRQELLDQVNAMGRAKNWVINVNSITADMQAAIAAGNASLANDAFAGVSAGLRTSLQNAVNAGQALMDGISAINGIAEAQAKNAEFDSAISEIYNAKEAFEMVAANRANPTKLRIENLDMSAWGSTRNLSTSTDLVTSNNWNLTGGNSFKQWQLGRDSATFVASDGWNMNQWRGNTVSPNGKAQLITTLTQPGLYEFRAKASAKNDNLSQYLTIGTIKNEYVYDADEDDWIQTAVDTLYHPNIRLFFGQVSAPDSVTVSKNVANTGANSGGTPNSSYITVNCNTSWSYSVFFLKTGNDAVEVELGLEAFENTDKAGANGFGFGACEVFYVGDETQYIADTKVELAAEIAKARALAEANNDNRDKQWIIRKLNRYIGDGEAATTAKDLQNAYLSICEMEWLLELTPAEPEPVIDGVKSVTEPVAVKQLGVYSLSGQKMQGDLKSLKPGLYIINGKKYIVK